MIFGNPDHRFSQSPTDKLHFIWIGEYSDGTHLAEYEFDNSTKKNDFYSIRKADLIRFGLVGCDHRMYFEVPGGVFKLAGRMIEVIYKEDDREYYLTGQPKSYNDIITYKDAESIVRPIFSINGTSQEPQGGNVSSQILAYNFGYKTELVFDGIRFNFQAICTLPILVGNPYINFKLVADREVKGQLAIKRNGKIVTEIEAPLQEKHSGEINWELI